MRGFRRRPRPLMNNSFRLIYAGHYPKPGARHSDRWLRRLETRPRSGPDRGSGFRRERRIVRRPLRPSGAFWALAGGPVPRGGARSWEREAMLRFLWEDVPEGIEGFAPVPRAFVPSRARSTWRPFSVFERRFSAVQGLFSPSLRPPRNAITSDTGMVPDDTPVGARQRLLDPAIMGPPIVWLASPAGPGSTASGSSPPSSSSGWQRDERRASCPAACAGPRRPRGPWVGGAR
jgi:hypothetical protein